jgi:aspartyl-tRNA(Asn)/glutamyl-tRNA(Gln) amidotransferase subunit A
MRTLTEQAAAVASKDVSAAELVQACLTRIEDVQSRCNAFTVVMADQALERASALDAETPTGPLHGVPVAVKDLYDVRGLATTGCCAAFEDRIASRDSAVVEALREAGAIVIAKTNQHELACGTTNQVSSSGPALNPWGTDRIPGGSSGGSGIAVATGVVPMAMGSDTGGSIRIPASFCGVTGLKPTHGAISTRGMMPMTPSCDTAGPLAVSAADCLAVWQAISGFDPDDAWSVDATPPLPPENVDRLRLAVPRSFMQMLHPDVRTALEEAAHVFEECGLLLDEVEGPDLDGLREAFIPMLFAEVAHHYEDLAGDERVLPPTRALIDFGMSVTGRAYTHARETALRLRRNLEWSLTAADALLVPTTPYPAPRITDNEIEVEGGKVDVHLGGPTRFTLPVNVTGLPAISFPIGLTPDGLPLSAQLIGRPWTEETLCLIATAYQEATDHHLRQPQT